MGVRVRTPRRARWDCCAVRLVGKMGLLRRALTSGECFLKAR